MCTDAKRLADRVEIDAGACAFGVLTLHQVRNAECELDHFDAAQNVALGVGNGLAMLAGQQFGQRVIVARHQLQELHEYARAALRVGCRPCRLCCLGVGNRLVEFGLGAERHLGAHAAVQRLENIGFTSRTALDVLAAY